MWKDRSHEERLKAFAQAAPGCGPLLDLSAGDSVLRRQAADAQAIAALYWPRGFAASCGFDFECAVYHDYASNAFATHADGVHWIAVSSGMVYTLAELAMRVAADFPTPDDAEAPITLVGAEGSGFRFEQPDFNDSIDEAGRFFRQIDLFGPIRRSLVQTLWLDAQTLIWRHEFFHASLGHTRYVDAAFGLRALMEYGGSTVQRPEAELRKVLRALEFHADWAAFGSTLKLVRSKLDPAGGKLRPLGSRWRAASLMAATLLLPAFFRLAETRGAPTSDTHPSAAARLSIFLSRIEELPDSAERAEWRQGTGLALQAFQSMAARHADFAAFAQMLGEQALDEGASERLACIDDFDSLQEVLAPYAVLPLGHPHQGSIDALPTDDNDDGER